MPKERKTRHQDWHVVADAPTAARITRRVTGKWRWDFVDNNGLVVATQQGDELSTAGRTYTFTEAGLEDPSTNKVIIPKPRRRRVINALTWGATNRAVLDMPDGSRLFWGTTRSPAKVSSSKSSAILRPIPAKCMAAISNQSGEVVVILSGRGENADFKHMSEALIDPDVNSPVPHVLLAAYAFQLLGLGDQPASA